MGCGCGQSKKGKTADDPITIGEPNGAEPVFVRAEVSVAGLSRGVERWVTGSSVAELIERGFITEQTPVPA